MANIVYFAICVVTFALIHHSSSTEEDYQDLESDLSDHECFLLGFNRDNLLCSSCNLLVKYDLEKLRNNCSRCCNELDTKLEQPVKKYERAKLEVCWCKFQSMPQIEAFIKSDRPKQFPTLTIKHVDGQSPIIKLINERGMVEQTLSIAKWDTDTIEEFLQTYLI